MAPYRWQQKVRRFLGYWVDEWTHPLSFPTQLSANKRHSYQIFLGATPNLSSLDCHFTLLAEGETPHPPHVHDDEEIIIPLQGKVDILRAATPDSTETTDERVGYGRLVYHPSRLPHTIRATGPGPSGYLVLRWSNPAIEKPPEGAVGAQSFDFGGLLASEPAVTEGRSRTLLFEGPTRLLQRLHTHASFARTGEGSAPHEDRHDVAVVVLEGAVETTSGRVEAPGIIFHPAGQTHFLKCVGTQSARYLAIEFLQRH